MARERSDPAAPGNGPVWIVVDELAFVAPLKQALWEASRRGPAGAGRGPFGPGGQLPEVGTLATLRDRVLPLRQPARHLRILKVASALEAADPTGDRLDWKARLATAGCLLDLFDALADDHLVGLLSRRWRDRSTAGDGLAGLAAPDAAAPLHQRIGRRLDDAFAAFGAGVDPLRLRELFDVDLDAVEALARACGRDAAELEIQAGAWSGLRDLWQATSACVLRLSLAPLAAGGEPDDPDAPGDADDDESHARGESGGTEAAAGGRFADRLIALFARRTPAVRWIDAHPADGVLAAQAPGLVAAWPEVASSAQDAADPAPGFATRSRGFAPIAARIRRPGEGGPVPAILQAGDRESESLLAADWVHARLLGGCRSIAIVVCDHWLARRVRALLERAGVLVDDREGWALSTTVAATTVMAWLDYSHGQEPGLAMQALLDSGFVAHPSAADASRLLRATTRPSAAAGGDEAGRRAALAASRLLADLEAIARRSGSARTPQALFATLREALSLLGAWERLAADEAGRQVLGLLGELAGALAGEPGARVAGRFQALFAHGLEAQRFHDRTIESPVKMLSPADALGQQHDALLVLGANEGRLPSRPPNLPAVPEALRPAFGLEDAAVARSRQIRALAWILADARETALTCRNDEGDGTLPSPLVERLAVVHRIDLDAAYGSLPALDPAIATTAAHLRWPLPRPAESVALPARLSVSAIERLVRCPYDFLVRDVWGLAERETEIEAPGKRELGIVVHDALLRFHRERADEDAATRDPQPLADRLEQLSREAVSRLPGLAAARLVHLQEWFGVVPAYVAGLLADEAQGWRFRSGEQRIERDLALAADGAAIRLIGKYDRIDAARRAGADASGDAGPSADGQGADRLRLIDYKLKDEASLRKRAREPDASAQLLLYGWMTGAGELAYLSIDRGGVAEVPLEPQAADTWPRWQERLVDALSAIADGTALRALGSHCSYCPSRGVCRQGHWDEST